MENIHARLYLPAQPIVKSVSPVLLVHIVTSSFPCLSILETSIAGSHFPSKLPPLPLKRKLHRGSPAYSLSGWRSPLHHNTDNIVKHRLHMPPVLEVIRSFHISTDSNHDYCTKIFSPYFSPKSTILCLCFRQYFPVHVIKCKCSCLQQFAFVIQQFHLINRNCFSIMNCPCLTHHLPGMNGRF